jgi:nitrogen fixation/metabolism regulation signal transduction histidine kinase
MASETVNVSARSTQVDQARSILWVLLTVVAVGATASSLVLLATASERQISGTIVETIALGFNFVGVVLLATLITRKLVQLRRDYKKVVPGSRMRARAVGMITLITLIPILVVYLFSLNTINRSIDSWFDATMGNGLRDALTLSRTALSLRTRELSEHTKNIAGELVEQSELSWRADLDRYRRFAGASVLMVVGEHNQIVAFSADFSESPLPALPAEEVLLQARSGGLYTSLEPSGSQGYRLLTSIRLPEHTLGGSRVLVATYPVTAQLSELGNRVEQAHTHYASMMYNRPILKSSFVLTLTVVMLLAILGAVYGAFFWVSRFVRPVEDLMGGTLAVSRGELETRLPKPSDDELGVLIQAFNYMTERLAQARSESELRRRLVDGERERLAIILSRLNSGILALSADGVLLEANEAASRVLGISLDVFRGQSLATIAIEKPELTALIEWMNLANPQHDPREPVTLNLPSGSRDLLLIHTDLPVVSSGQVGRLWVLDDLTNLLRAQRDAAWGEVARRLAHEIKNPLTPIQLSADRMRRRLMEHLSDKEADILESGTRTIVHQVEAMRQMVNAFSEYAKAPSLLLQTVHLNDIVSEVVSLYDSTRTRSNARFIRIERRLDPSVPPIQADPHRLRQVLHNLLTNAMDALEGQADPQIDVKTACVTRESAPMVELVVADNGAGFPQGLGDRVFDPYITSKEKGTGLGLAIVKKIVDEHGGHILAENSTPVGARLVIYWPVGKIDPQDSVG